jgi:hypothetical protein
MSMPEMLVQVIDRSSPDPLIDCRCFKAGDVIVVCPDGWAWSDAELNNPEWRIVSVALPTDEAEAFAQDEAGDMIQNPLLQIRGSNIDIDALPVAARLKMRGQRAGTVTILPAVLRLARLIKARRANLQILGGG